VLRVLNSMAAGRRLAKRTLLAQAVATLLLALAFLLAGPQAALGALCGGGALLLGNALLAWRGLRRDTPAAGYAMGQLVVGLVMKWMLVALVLAIALGVMKLPAPAVLGGLIVSLVAFAAAGATAKN
jgi:ATP synthase protein I